MATPAVAGSSAMERRHPSPRRLGAELLSLPLPLRFASSVVGGWLVLGLFFTALLPVSAALFGSLRTDGASERASIPAEAPLETEERLPAPRRAGRPVGVVLLAAFVPSLAGAVAIERRRRGLRRAGSRLGQGAEAAR